MVTSSFSCWHVLNEYNISFIVRIMMGSISASIYIIIAGAAEMHVRQGLVSMLHHCIVTVTAKCCTSGVKSNAGGFLNG